MKTKLFILLVSIGAGSNVAAMEWFSPEALNAFDQAKTTSKQTDFILGCLSKSANMTGNERGLFWKDEFLKAEPGTSEATTDTSYVRDGIEINFHVEKYSSYLSDPRIHDIDHGHVYIHTKFFKTNPALNKEHGFDYVFRYTFDNPYIKITPMVWKTRFIHLDRSTRCGYDPENNYFECRTHLFFEDFAALIQKMNQKEEQK